MEQEHNGYFKVGDGIEISGQFFGIVKIVDGDLMWIHKKINSSFPETIIIQDLEVYKNETEHFYKDKYWTKKCSIPSDFSFTSYKELT
jgi:hypothetical protein